MSRILGTILAASALALIPDPAAAQWERHYPKVAGYGHQLYMEQEHLPIFSSGPAYPAASPDGRQLAFAHQGWIWLLDLETSVARRITDGAGIDGRPRWSPDGKRLAFVRDTGSDTQVVILSLADGAEQIVDTPAIDLDPEFSRDGASLFYSSAQDGRFAIWRRSLADGSETRISQGTRARRSPRALADGRVVFQAEEGAIRSIRLAAGDGTGETTLVEQGWMAHLEPDVHPSGASMVYALADGNQLRLAVMDTAHPEAPRWLTPAGGRALQPTFSADGRTVFFVTADANEQFSLHRIDAAGGVAEPVAIARWDYGVPTGSATIAVSGPARLSIERADGHPVANPAGASYVNNQDGEPYWYLYGPVDLQLPEGDYRAVFTRGPFSLPETREFTVAADRPVAVSAEIAEIWDAQAAGYASADLHVHLNASGVHELTLEDLVLPMRGEALDYAVPMAWNQHNRFVDAARIGERLSAPDGTTAVLSQEVRSDFHGHVGMIGLAEAYNPWFFGPNIPTYVDQNYNNGDAIAFATARGALATYVHPVGGAGDPFASLETSGIPLELILDGVLTPGIGLEIVCQWTSALGTSEVWYRLLNIGRAVPATSGTDMMANFYRLPAVGTARSYVPAKSPGFEAMVEQVREGTGFVTTGPALLFSVDNRTPGQTVGKGVRDWTIELASVAAVDRVEILVNGEVVDTLEGFAGKGRKTYRGKVTLPAGGWVAARAVGGGTAGENGGPSMTVFPFAHSSPVWIGSVGSSDPAARRAAARDLLAALAHAERRFAESYSAGMPAGLATRFAAARQELERLAR